jgi:hypothetical protein
MRIKQIARKHTGGAAPCREQPPSKAARKSAPAYGSIIEDADMYQDFSEEEGSEDEDVELGQPPRCYVAVKAEAASGIKGEAGQQDSDDEDEDEGGHTAAASCGCTTRMLT